DYFGWSVALASSGGTALIGAYGKTVSSNSGEGAAYVFTGGGATWTQQAELTASDGAAHDNFGYSVALASSAAAALIGAHGKAVGANTNQGGAYVFSGNGAAWSQQAELIAGNGAAYDQYGGSAALSANAGTTLVGAPPKTVNGSSGEGAAYVFVAQPRID